MIHATRRLSDVMEELERLKKIEDLSDFVRKSLEARRTRGDSVQIEQLTPTAMWHLYAGTNRIGRIVSLGPNDMQRGSRDWQPDREHWFFDAGVTNVKQELTGASTLTLELYHICSSHTPDTKFLGEVDDIIANNDPFQLEAKGVLSNSDWTELPTTWGNDAFYYRATTAASEDTRAHVVIEMKSDNELTKITWVCGERHAGYNGTLEFEKKTKNDLPSTGWYYSAERPSESAR